MNNFLTVFAHPGDHSISLVQGLVHLLTEPDHLAMIAVAALVVAAVVYKRHRRSV